MKKCLSLILAAVMVVTMFAGCGSANEPSTTGSPVSTSAVTTAPESTTPETTIPETTASQSIDTDEGLFTVDITLPASMFEGEDMSTFDTDAYVKENGFLSAAVNDDGSVTVTMTKSKHKELIDEMSASLDTSFAEFVEAEDTPYIKEISHNDDFSSIVIKVKRAEYENAWDFTAFSVGVSAMFFQAFLDMEYHVEVAVIDVDTGETIESVVYPDAFEE